MKNQDSSCINVIFIIIFIFSFLSVTNAGPHKAEWIRCNLSIYPSEIITNNVTDLILKYDIKNICNNKRKCDMSLSIKLQQTYNYNLFEPLNESLIKNINRDNKIRIVEAKNMYLYVESVELRSQDILCVYVPLKLKKNLLENVNYYILYKFNENGIYNNGHKIIPKEGNYSEYKYIHFYQTNRSNGGSNETIGNGGSNETIGNGGSNETIGNRNHLVLLGYLFNIYVNNFYSMVSIVIIFIILVFYPSICKSDYNMKYYNHVKHAENLIKDSNLNKNSFIKYQEDKKVCLRKIYAAFDNESTKLSKALFYTMLIFVFSICIRDVYYFFVSSIITLFFGYGVQWYPTTIENNKKFIYNRLSSGGSVDISYDYDMKEFVLENIGQYPIEITGWKIVCITDSKNAYSKNDSYITINKKILNINEQHREKCQINNVPPKDTDRYIIRYILIDKKSKEVNSGIMLVIAE